ncbi:CBS domain-containing protein [Methanocella conradii]|uniref:CBS domain-containing protein n=1 Tax=Methanocella conradii TaxID=1175444 RepID=UPI0024B342BF|nr:CBS domain-containing protein [Methanocella conradii]MDI6897993.1 CBS domain-containing protein [Methanocella conradii]
MKVGDIMSTNPQYIGPDEFVTHAREIMREYNYESLPVVENGRVVGMVTLQDIINVTSTRSDVTVTGYMRLTVPALSPETGLAKAASVIIGTDEGRVPVVNGNGRLVGMLSVKDIFKGLAELELEDVSVGSLMTREVVVCRPEDSVSKAWLNMINYGLTGFPVVGPKGEVIGMITREDVLKRGYARIERESEGRRTPTTVQKIMSTPAITVKEDDSVKKAAKIFMERDIGRVPVVKNGKLAGIIDRYDVIRACRALQGVATG